MEHLKSLNQQADTNRRDILDSMSTTRGVVREGNATMVGIKALLEAHIQLHSKN